MSTKTAYYVILTVFLQTCLFQKIVAAQAAAAPIVRSPSTQLSDAELKIWNDPDFKRRFAESYIAETDIEPRVTVAEREKMQEVLELISSNQLEEAALLLLNHLGQAESTAEQPEKKSWLDGFRKKQEAESDGAGDGAASAVFDFTLANIYFQQEKLDEAVTVYQAAVDKYPKFRRAWKNLGLIYVRQGNFERAIPALTRVIELGGNDAVTFGLLAFSYASVENYLPAESAYRMAVLLDPATMDWKMGLVRSLFKQEKYAEASALCDRLIQDRPDRAELWLLQANAYIGLDQPMKAAENYELVDRLGLSTVDSLNMLGDIYVNQELYGLAVKSYIKAMDKDPQGKPDRVLRSAKILVARGALDETRELIERIEKQYGNQIDPEAKKDFLKLQARLAVAEGAGEEEVHVLERIVEIDPLDGEALILLGQNSSRNGDVEKAIFYYERAESLPDFEADAKVRHAQLLVGSGKYDEALPLLRRAQAIKPRDNIQEYLEQVERVAKSRG